MRQLLLPYPLALTVDCRTTREPGGRVVEHEVTLHADGTVTTPHDLDSERIAAALGGYLSCLDLVDHGVPALEAWTRLVSRSDGVPIVSPDDGHSWLPRSAASCCNRHGYHRPEVAFSHARSPGHLASVFHVDHDLLRQLLDAAAVPEPRGPRGEPEARLWQCGIPPEVASRVRAVIGARHEVTASDILAVIAVGRDLEWLESVPERYDRKVRRVLARVRGDIAQLQLELVDPELVRKWQRSTAPQWAIRSLLPAGYAPEDVDVIATHWKVSEATAAMVLTGWVENGFRIDVAALTGPRLAHLRMPPRPPSRHALDRLRRALAAVAPRGGMPSETELALLLVEKGTVADTVAAVRSGP